MTIPEGGRRWSLPEPRGRESTDFSLPRKHERTNHNAVQPKENGKSEHHRPRGEASDDPVFIQAEISGPRDEVLAQLTGERSTRREPDPEYEYAALEEVVQDLTMVLRAVEQTDGAIRSKIADHVDTQLGEWHTRKILELLREYDLVELEKNTWVPGPACEREPADDATQ